MNKKNLILGGVLIFLIVLAYAYQGPLKKWQANLGKPSNFLAKAETQKIDKMEIIKGGETTVLEKKDERWKVNPGEIFASRISQGKDFYVNRGVSENLIKKLEEARIAKLELVSVNKDKRKEFGIEDGVNVKLFQENKEMVNFIVGKSGNDYLSTYLALSEGGNIYSVPVNLFDIFNQDDWRDWTVFSSDKDKIAKIRFQYPNREFTVEKKDGKWIGAAPYKFIVKNEKIDEILDIMSDLTAVAIPEQNFVGTGLEKNLIIVQATGEGVDNTIMIGNHSASSGQDEGGRYYAKNGNSDNIYLITKEQRDELDKYIWQLR